MLDTASIDRAMTIVKTAKRICCICHRNPDGDALGSITGIAQILSALVPHTKVQLYCVDSPPSTFSYLPWIQRIESNLLPREGDVFVFVDSAEPKLTEYHEKFPHIFGGIWPSICFDHHPTNPRYATENFVLPEAASTCEIITEFADQISIAITPDIATCLLTGVYTDTGGLVHSNTTAKVYRTVSRLLRAGARHQLLVQHVFRTAKLSTLRLWGRALEKISLTEEGGAISALTEGDFRATGAEYSELTGAIDYVNAVPGMKFSLVLAERAGKVKGSLRTMRDDIDVAKMAAKFQGGGHKKAAGFALTGKLVPEMRWKVAEQQLSTVQQSGKPNGGG